MIVLCCPVCSFLSAAFTESERVNKPSTAFGLSLTLTLLHRVTLTLSICESMSSPDLPINNRWRMSAVWNCQAVSRIIGGNRQRPKLTPCGITQTYSQSDEGSCSDWLLYACQYNTCIIFPWFTTWSPHHTTCTQTNLIQFCFVFLNWRSNSRSKRVHIYSSSKLWNLLSFPNKTRTSLISIQVLQKGPAS